MRKIISLISLLMPLVGFAATADTPPQLRSDAPDRHVVVTGDTLWDISATFFKDPWRWPYIWGMNKETIRDPHWIYPGDVILLDREHGTLRISHAQPERDTVKLSPRIRTSPSPHDAIPSIPARDIEAFLRQPLVVSDSALAGAATLIGARDNRVILGAGDTAFASGITQSSETYWQVFRPGAALIDPVSGEALGTEVIYLGEAELVRQGEVSTLAITRSVQEINTGDRLLARTAALPNAYLPRAPQSDIQARVMSIYGAVEQGGQGSIITLNKGQTDGLQPGHVLALFRKGDQVHHDGKDYTLPDERYGVVFVFRVFDHVSYALVMNTHLPVQTLDRAATP